MKQSNLDKVLEAVKDLHNQEQIATRETIAELTGLKQTVIDDRLKHLADEGLIHRVQRGVFVPAPEHKPARLITKTLLPDGSVSIEIGDDDDRVVLTLTPREARMLGQAMTGEGLQYSNIETGHQNAILAAELAGKVRQLERQLTALQRSLRPDHLAQMDMLTGIESNSSIN